MAVEEMLKQALETANATDSTDTSKKESKESEWYPLTSFAFMLRVELAFDLPCRAIKGLRRENEFDYIQEGGLNDYVHMKRKPISRPFTFQVERYVGLDYLDPLPLGVELVLPVLLFVNPYPFRNSSFFKPVRSYAFMGCTVTAKDYGELNAESSGLLVETTTIAFREMACIDLPSKWLNKSSWDFAVEKNKDGKMVPSYEGQGESNRNTRDQMLRAEATRSKEDMEKLAAAHVWPAKSSADIRDMKTPESSLWKFSGQEKAGNNKRNYLRGAGETNTPKVEKTRETMKNAARQWPEKTSAKKSEMKTPEASLWKFDAKKKAGNNERNYLHRENGTNTPDAEKTREQMNAKAQQWAFDGNTKAGNAKRYYQHVADGTNTPEVEATREQMNAKAQQWAFDEKKKAGNAKRGYQHTANGTNTPEVEKTKEQMQEKASSWPAKESAEKRTMKTPQPRQGGAVKQEMKTPSPRTGGAVIQEMKTPEAKKWPDQSSAVQPPSSKAESRKWPKEKSAQKAQTTNRKKKSSSSQSKKSSSSKSKVRVWPKTSSAQTAQTANIKGAGRNSSGGPGRKTSGSPRAGRR